ncbi:hypothetical protein LTR36_008131 [Oleoguttula mirabilis]|uniref:NADAR domain-containing protein n=1 Tax=Oleoguttula mirabilis TaxID=1507867 RepID=A0AAV9J847_9PEZI|nr:hypothetical protein LTR36_008131 [Oleoguttula mirabilis]
MAPGRKRRAAPTSDGPHRKRQRQNVLSDELVRGSDRESVSGAGDAKPAANPKPRRPKAAASARNSTAKPTAKPGKIAKREPPAEPFKLTELKPKSGTSKSTARKTANGKITKPSTEGKEQAGKKTSKKTAKPSTDGKEQADKKMSDKTAKPSMEDKDSHTLGHPLACLRNTFHSPYSDPSHLPAGEGYEFPNAETQIEIVHAAVAKKHRLEKGEDQKHHRVGRLEAPCDVSELPAYIAANGGKPTFLRLYVACYGWTPEAVQEWAEMRWNTVVHAVMTKFEFREHLWDKLLATGDKTIVELSADKVFGIGFEDATVALQSQDGWGLNVFGCALMIARTRIRQKKIETRDTEEQHLRLQKLAVGSGSISPVSHASVKSEPTDEEMGGNSNGIRRSPVFDLGDDGIFGDQTFAAMSSTGQTTSGSGTRRLGHKKRLRSEDSDDEGSDISNLTMENNNDGASEAPFRHYSKKAALTRTRNSAMSSHPTSRALLGATHVSMRSVALASARNLAGASLLSRALLKTAYPSGKITASSFDGSEDYSDTDQMLRRPVKDWSDSLKWQHLANMLSPGYSSDQQERIRVEMSLSREDKRVPIDGNGRPTPAGVVRSKTSLLVLWTPGRRGSPLDEIV